MPNFPRRVIKILSESNMSEKVRAWVFACTWIWGRMPGIRHHAAAARQRFAKKEKKGMNRRLVAISFPRTMHHSLQSCVQTMRHNGTSATLVCVCLCYRWDAPLSDIPEDMEAQRSPQGLKLTAGNGVPRCLPGIKYLWRLIQHMAWDILWLKSFKRWFKKAANI